MEDVTQSLGETNFLPDWPDLSLTSPAASPVPEGSTDAAIIFESGFFGGGPTSSIRFTAIVESKSEGVSGPVLAECYFVPRFF